MSASYPSAAKSFAPIVDGVDYPQATDLNEAYDEITAVQAALLTGGLEHNLFPESSADARTLGTASKFWGLAYLKGLTLSAASTLTIAGGIVTNLQGYHAVDTESAAGTDDLDTITAGSGIQEGSILILRAANVSHVVTLKDGTGNLLLNGDYALSATDRTIMLILDGTNWRELARSVQAATIPLSCDGRLTLTTALPVTTADVTGAGTIYFTPYRGNRIALYDGSSWALYSLTEKSLALTLTSGKNYDVFVYNNSGTLTLELSAAWTNDTTRADALTLQDGVLVKSGSTTKRYLGTIRASGSNTTEDSVAKGFVWNYYNRVARPMRAVDTTNSWTYTTAAWQQANNAAGNKIEVVVGVAEDAIDVTVQHLSTNTNANVFRYAAVGEDSVTSPATGCIRGASSHNLTALYAPLLASLRTVPAVGYHYYAWLEYSEATGTSTWYGDNGAALLQSGINAMWWR